MAVHGCMKCIKYCLLVFNFIFWTVGCTFVVIGIWLTIDAKNFMDSANVPSDVQKALGNGDAEAFSVLGTTIIAFGATIFILGFLGCCGALRESQTMLSLFFTFLLLLFLALTGASILVFVYGDKMKAWLKEQLDREAISEKETPNGLLSFANHRFGCCGVDDQPVCLKNYSPYSQCQLGSPKCSKGCYPPLSDAIDKLKINISIPLLVAGSLMIFGMIFSMCLCCAIRDANAEEAINRRYNRYY